MHIYIILMTEARTTACGSKIFVFTIVLKYFILINKVVFNPIILSVCSYLL